MALSFPQLISPRNDRPVISLNSDFLPQPHFAKIDARKTVHITSWNSQKLNVSITCSSVKLVRDRSLDRHVVKQNKIRFVQKLKTLLLSKPKHFMPLHILAKCRSYLSLSKPKSVISMIHRYPTIFELFSMPTARTPFNATKSLSQLCVRLTPAAAALAAQESALKSAMSTTMATKLQKLLMLASHNRLLLSKLVHLGPDLGLPPNFRRRLCNDHPDKFKTINTSYGRALELVSWDPNLANPLPSLEYKPHGLIVDRPLKFKHLRLRKGLNVKRPHQEFLLKFSEMTDICPYKTKVGELAKESLEAEKRACDVVREVLAMTVEKRTLVDHLTHFRKEFGLPNKLRGMLVRHPELFYVSVKGDRDSVFLVEGFDEKGGLLEKDDTLEIKKRLMELVWEGKRIRRERRNATGEYNDAVYKKNSDVDYDYGDGDGDDDDNDDLDTIFEYDSEDDTDDFEIGEALVVGKEAEFWTAEAAALASKSEDSRHLEPW